MKTPVYVSFGFDNVPRLKDFMIMQARRADSPSQVVDHSLKEAAPERSWETKASRAIARSRVVLAMVGRETYRAQGVLKEIAIARQHGKRIIQIIGYKDGDYTPVKGAGMLYRWNWENLKKILP